MRDRKEEVEEGIGVPYSRWYTNGGRGSSVLTLLLDLGLAKQITKKNLEYVHRSGIRRQEWDKEKRKEGE